MWYYNNSLITDISDLPPETLGFIYKITNLSQKERCCDLPYQYIGRKNIYSETTKPLGKREIAKLTDKRASKKIKSIKESDWLNYNSSCKPLLEHVSNGDLIHKEILKFCFTKLETTYSEAKFLFCENVLDDITYYNNNILSKFFKTK
jgi:hypothetical protein